MSRSPSAAPPRVSLSAAATWSGVRPEAPGSTALRMRRDLEGVDAIGAIRRMASRVTPSRSDADDLVQDTFVRALGSAHRFRPGTNLLAWLTTILTNLASNRRRDLARARVTADSTLVERAGVVAPAPDPEQALLDRTLDPDLQAALESLPARIRQAVWMRDVEDRTYAEIAQLQRVPQGTVMSRLSRGRRLLHERLLARAARATRGEPRP